MLTEGPPLCNIVQGAQEDIFPLGLELFTWDTDRFDIMSGSD